MKNYQTLSHVRWDCKYHLVFITKYRNKVIYGSLRKKIGAIIRELCRQKGIEIHEGHAMSDHIHLCISIPPKYSIEYSRVYKRKKCNPNTSRMLGTKKMTGLSFWAGYCISTVGLDEEMIKKYIKNQDKIERS